MSLIESGVIIYVCMYVCIRMLQCPEDSMSLTCMKLGTGGLYHTCARRVHTCHLPRDIQQVYACVCMYVCTSSTGSVSSSWRHGGSTPTAFCFSHIFQRLQETLREEKWEGGRERGREGRPRKGTIGGRGKFVNDKQQENVCPYVLTHSL